MAEPNAGLAPATTSAMLERYRRECAHVEASLAAAPQAHALYAQLAELNRLMGDLARSNGGSVNQIGEHLHASLGAVIAALKLAPENGEYLAEFARCARGARLVYPLPAELEALILRALEHPAVDPRHLVVPIVGLAKTHRDMRGIEQHLSSDVPLDESAWNEVKAALGRVLMEPLLRRLMEQTVIPDAFFERLAGIARRGALLETAKRVGAEPPLPLPALNTLAHQCFITEYVYEESDEERANLRALAAAIEARPVPAYAYAIHGCYRPLGLLKCAQRISAELADGQLRALAKIQIDEPFAERRLMATLPCLDAPASSASERVRAQYEENPYPRWLRIFEQARPGTLQSVLRDAFPGANLDDVPDRPAEILIAGCGTAQAMETSQRFPGSRILAVDLSLASLAYAKRKGDELGVEGVEFCQGDILGLSSVERRFDLVECTGVLHHLEKPIEGWRILKSLLRPRGLMRIALYSARARGRFEKAWAFIAAHKLEPTPEGIRRCRAAVLAEQEDEGSRALAQNPDFYSMSGCRDLLFHAIEHRFELPEIAVMLEELELDLVGLELPDWSVAELYRARFPEDARMLNLRNWSEFEAERPWTFTAMYRFWVRARS